MLQWPQRDTTFSPGQTLVTTVFTYTSLSEADDHTEKLAPVPEGVTLVLGPGSIKQKRLSGLDPESLEFLTRFYSRHPELVSG